MPGEFTMKDKKAEEKSANLPPPFSSTEENKEKTQTDETVIDYSSDPLRTATGGYRQEDWGLYHSARDKELENIRDFLWHLCRIPIEPEQTRGRPRLSFADKLFINYQTKVL